MKRARQVATRHLCAEDEQKCANACRGDLDVYIDEVMQLMGSNEQRGSKCRYCGKHTAVVKMLQTRSADEGMSALASCTSCKRRYTV